MNLYSLFIVVPARIVVRIDVIEVPLLNIVELVLLHLVVGHEALLLPSVQLLAQCIGLLIVMVLNVRVAALRVKGGFIFLVINCGAVTRSNLPALVPRTLIYRMVVAETCSEQVKIVCSSQSRSRKEIHAGRLPDQHG